MASKQRDRLLRLVRLQRADQMELSPGYRERKGGHFAFASCTLFSPNTRWPAAITGSIASAPKVFDTATSVTRGGVAAGGPAGLRNLLAHSFKPSFG
jgi:hypothetical protein